ncbi:MAG TPA: MarR family winged helix-turn-helix transcriptional regulator [Granulicella sp.]|jgi:DNA-binding MarR family transcriptional regulator
MHSDNAPDDDHFAIRQAARHVSKLYEHYLSRAGMTPTQHDVLVTVARISNPTMTDLAGAMVMDRTTVVRGLRVLLARGLLFTATDKACGRHLIIGITPKGREKLEEAAVYWEAAQAVFERSFGSEQATYLRKELFRITMDVPTK